MKPVRLSIILTGLLMPVICTAQPEGPPMGPPGKGKGSREERKGFGEGWKEADTDKDGSISRAEFDAFPRIQSLPEEKREHLFKRLDKDGDGLLKGVELVGPGGPRGEGPGGPAFRRLPELDTDKSGGISFEEFKIGEFFNKLPEERQLAVFKRLDTDGDGQLTPKDRPEPPDGRKREDRPERGRKGPMDPKEMIRELDTDRNGSLNFEEFRKGPFTRELGEDEQEDHFEKLDKNGDIKLDAEDFARPGGEGPPPGPGPDGPPHKMGPPPEGGRPPGPPPEGERPPGPPAGPEMKEE